MKSLIFILLSFVLPCVAVGQRLTLEEQRAIILQIRQVVVQLQAELDSVVAENGVVSTELVKAKDEFSKAQTAMGKLQTDIDAAAEKDTAWAERDKERARADREKLEKGVISDHLSKLKLWLCMVGAALVTSLAARYAKFIPPPYGVVAVAAVGVLSAVLLWRLL